MLWVCACTCKYQNIVFETARTILLEYIKLLVHVLGILWDAIYSTFKLVV